MISEPLTNEPIEWSQEQLKSYFVIDINGKDENDASGPFDTKAEAEEIYDLIANVKRIGALVITECERIEELQLLFVREKP